MQIGEAAEASGVSSKMIRHYEAIGLVPRPTRRSSNYRDYTKTDVHRFAFIRRARDLGFSIEQIRSLLRLWADKRRSSRQVKALALEHIAALHAKASALEEMAATLQQLADACDGNDRPSCPIIRSLASAALRTPEQGWATGERKIGKDGDRRQVEH
jgi:Cu(I)-responsive transcriptional regulator